jgi:hypothetical protein
MSTLLSSHLEQISLCATSIADLPFPGPKIFTNALLGKHEITSLIRDTELHERALFHLAAPAIPGKTSGVEYVPGAVGPAPVTTAARRQTMYGGGGGGGGSRQPKNKAVAAVLGGDLYQRTRRDEVTTGSARQKGEVDVEILLEGAERLAAVYPIPGATEKIANLRRRHQQLLSNVAHYESRVDEQSRELERIHGPSSRFGDDEQDEDDEVMHDDDAQDQMANAVVVTKEDLEREEAEIRELEAKKKALEERVVGMERDLGGLMR